MLVGLQAPTPAAAENPRARFRQQKAELLDRFVGARPTAPAATRLLKSLTRLVDRTLLARWRQAGLPEGAALVAVGGYGRGELFPHSDIDVLVLLPVLKDDNAAPMAAVEGFITACWDTGLEIGSSVRTVAECIVMAHRRFAAIEPSPTTNIRLVSPCQPSLMTVTSMFRVSPSFSGLSFGMPWQTTWLIDVQIDFG